MGSCSRRTTFAAVAIAATTVACEKPAEVKPSEPEVYVADVVQKDVPVYVDLVGETAGFQDVEIRARVEGFLQSVNFQEGAFVRAGQPLYEIDRKPLEATLAGAKADAVTAGAVLNKADNDVARYTPLAAKQAVSQEELDNARASQDAARSRVEAAKAAVEKASLDLGYTRVVSPSFVLDVADASAFLLRTRPATGLYHCVNTGHATWLEVGQEIVKRLGASDALLKPVSVKDVTLRASRPQFAALSNAKLATVGYQLPTWQDAIGRYVDLLRPQSSLGQGENGGQAPS
jgi:multidrug efflux pump subunit AcrA (membrane-fusion protein)